MFVVVVVVVFCCCCFFVFLFVSFFNCLKKIQVNILHVIRISYHDFQLCLLVRCSLNMQICSQTCGVLVTSVAAISLLQLRPTRVQQ